MTLPLEPSGWSGLKISSEFLEAGRKAPLPLPEESGTSYRACLAKLLEGVSLPEGVREAALSTGSGLLQGAQELLLSLHRLLEADSTPSKAQKAVHEVLVAVHALFRLRNAAYVLQQVGEVDASQRGAGSVKITLEGKRPEFPRIWRLKDYMTPLESALEPLQLSKHMEPERFASLLVHLDELYDDAILLLQRLFTLASRELDEARALAPELFQRLYTDFARASLGDHLVCEPPPGRKSEGESSAGAGRGKGLFDLLPELLEALRCC